MNTYKHNLFISYSHRDRPFVEKLSADLEKKGVKCWKDEKEIKVGDSIAGKIRDGIDSSQYLCVVISKHSINSEWVKREVDIATSLEIHRKEKRVLPLLLDESHLPWFLEGKLCAPFNISYDTGLIKLIDVVSPAFKDIFIIKEYSDTVDLFDPSGKRALVHSDWIIAVKKGVLATWGRCLHFDGFLKSVTTTPESIITIEKTGLFHSIRFNFTNTIKAGQTFSFRATFEVHDTFLQEKEWWGLSGGSGPCEGCIVNDAIRDDKPSIRVIFPQARPYKSFNAIIKRGEITPDSEPTGTYKNGRSVVLWENVRNRVNFTEEHMLLWEW